MKPLENDEVDFRDFFDISINWIQGIWIWIAQISKLIYITLLRTKFQITSLLCLFFRFIGTDFMGWSPWQNFQPCQILCKDLLNVVPSLVNIFSLLLQGKNYSTWYWCMGKRFQRLLQKTTDASTRKSLFCQVFHSKQNQGFSDRDAWFDFWHSKPLEDEI